MDKITICMGSSCFSRSNGSNVELVQKFLESNNLIGKVAIEGCLCRGQCKDGPNIEVNGKTFGNVNADNLPKILREQLGAW